MSYSLTVAATVLVIAGVLPAQSTTRVNLSSSGTQGDGPSDIRPVISADGRFVAWSSRASNHVPGDTNEGQDVFVRDLLSGITERASVSSAGAQVQPGSTAPSISADGRFVAFQSAAADLVESDANWNDDVFVRDRWSGVTEVVSVTPAGATAAGLSATPSISADGSRVAFSSSAEDLVPGDWNGKWDVFVHDRLSGLTVRVSLPYIGLESNGNSGHPSISADGRYVAFVSYASNLIALDMNGDPDVFVRDLVTGVTTLVHKNSAGYQADYDVDDISAPGISADGRYIAFGSLASNLVGADTNTSYDVFVHDQSTGLTSRISRSLAHGPANSHSRECRISADGRYVAYASWASDIVFDDYNDVDDVFFHDRLTGTTERLNVGNAGETANFGGLGLAMSADARRIVFHSGATTLVVGDTNNVDDIFLRDRETSPSVSLYCFGDGSGAACPCVNPSPAGVDSGCANSLDLYGSLRSIGMPHVYTDTFVLVGAGMPNSSALYFQGTSDLVGGLGAPFGDGLRCAGGTILRLATKSNAAGTSRYPEEGDAPVSVRGLVPPGGGTRTYQAWYRNAAAFCTASTFNLTNGLSAVWVP